RDRVPGGDRRLVGSAAMVRGVTRSGVPVEVPVSVMEGNEDDSWAHTADAHPSLAGPPPPLDPHGRAFRSAYRSGVLVTELPPRIRGGVVQLRCPSSLGAGVELVDGAAGGQQGRDLPLTGP